MNRMKLVAEVIAVDFYENSDLPRQGRNVNLRQALLSRKHRGLEIQAENPA